MKTAQIISFVFLSIFLSGCSKVLSRRTDEQLWLEFDREERHSRVPASVLVPMDEALSQIPFRSLLLKCDLQGSPETCFHSALVLNFDEVFRSLQGPEQKVDSQEYRKAQKDFLAAHSYEQLVSEVNRFHQSILSGLDFKAHERAHHLFEKCDAEKRSELVITRFDLLTGIVNEVPKGVYGCFVSNWQEYQDTLLQETTERLGLVLVTEEAKTWVKKHQISFVFNAALKESISKKAKLEELRFKENRSEIFKGFNFSESEEELVKLWAPRLREEYAYSPVEQWVVAYRRSKE